MAWYSDNPCRYCVEPKRHPGCHSAKVCKEWAEWEPIAAENKQKVRESIGSTTQFTAYSCEQNKKIRKAWMKKNRI